MISKPQRAHLCLSMFLLLLAASTLAYAGPTVIGLVKGSTNASVGGQALLPDTILFNGDRLEVSDGVAVVALASTSRLVFQRDTVASFQRDSDELTVLLGQGGVSLFHGENTLPVRVKVGDISVVPVSEFETLGEVAAGNGMVVVTAKDGKLRVEGNGQAIVVAKGETVTLATRAKAPWAAKEPTVPKPPGASLPSTAYPSPVQIRETGPSGSSLSASPIGPSLEASAKADELRAALYPSVPAGSAPVMEPAPADTIELALTPLVTWCPSISPYKPPPPSPPPPPYGPHRPRMPHMPHGWW